MRRIWWWEGRPGMNCDPLACPWLKPFRAPLDCEKTLWTAEVWDDAQGWLVRFSSAGGPGWDTIARADPPYPTGGWFDGQFCEVVDVEKVWDWFEDGHDGAWDSPTWWQDVLAKFNLALPAESHEDGEKRTSHAS